MPENLAVELEPFMQSERKQETLNEFFHLLKKYDSAPESEREERDWKLKGLL